MNAFIENPDLLINEFNEMASISQRKAFITVGIEIQKEEIKVLKEYREDLHALKKEFIKLESEIGANIVFCVESSLLAIQYELQMLVDIKEDKMGNAWDNLVDAQVVYGNVIKNSPIESLSNYGYLDRLAQYEKLLFPNFYFQSVGGIIKKSHCSICNESFSRCEHIKGRLYMGELCCRVITEMDLEEVSFVDNPANKHCRIITMEFDGSTIDFLTLREVSAKINPELI
nr:hypothetical protein [Tanacetum cinerariifolium]